MFQNVSIQEQVICIYLIIIFLKSGADADLFPLMGAELLTQRPLTAAPGTEAGGAVQRSDHSP